MRESRPVTNTTSPGAPVPGPSTQARNSNSSSGAHRTANDRPLFPSRKSRAHCTNASARYRTTLYSDMETDTAPLARKTRSFALGSNDSKTLPESGFMDLARKDPTHRTPAFSKCLLTSLFAMRAPAIPPASAKTSVPT